MRGASRTDRLKATPTELAQLERCEIQIALDARHGRRRTSAWRRKAATGTQAHAAVEAVLTSPWSATGVRLLLRALVRRLLFGMLGTALAAALVVWTMARLPNFIAAVMP